MCVSLDFANYGVNQPCCQLPGFYKKTCRERIPAGIVGGATCANPTARTCLKILGVQSARELAGIMAAVGLAQNFAALHTLVTTGIQSGYAKCLHKKIV